MWTTNWFAGEAPFGVIQNWSDLGVLGGLAIILIYLSYALIKREQARADRLEIENNKLHEQMTTKTEMMIPILVQSQEALQNVLKELQEGRRDRDVAQRIAEDRIRRQEGRVD
jgi:hypothetical protein